MVNPEQDQFLVKLSQDLQAMKDLGRRDGLLDATRFLLDQGLSGLARQMLVHFGISLRPGAGPEEDRKP